MAVLSRELRKTLADVVAEARNVAEEAARKALKALAVGERDPYRSMTDGEKTLRNRLREHGRQLGDVRNTEKGTQELDHLVAECAYEHWHRMLFAQFLADNHLLLEPETGVAIAIDEVKELARGRAKDWVVLAGEFAVQMLPQVFRQDDPVLAVEFAPEDRRRLEDLVEQLPSDVFTASDSLGWTYQFWQAEKKEAINASGDKIGAHELPAVTQLFTEDYMVDFLLDNTLGAWYAGRILAANPELSETAQGEEQLRLALALPGCSWSYLRFDRAENGKWTPAAGTFDGWPEAAKELTCLDPCMGSGHFVVAMFERLVALRVAEEKLEESTAVAAVIRDNLFGLEIDPRCTQISAFNLALAAWRRIGHRSLPTMNLACCGCAPNARYADWLTIASGDQRLERGMERLYSLFYQAPILGSLINPQREAGDLLAAGFHELVPLLEKVLPREADDGSAHETAVTAHGLAKAAEILSGKFTLVATNVPYLGYKKQRQALKQFCERVYPDSKHDLATCLVERGLAFCSTGGSVALVTPHNWLFLGAYLRFRERLLKESQWDFVASVGSRGFQTPMYDFSIVLLSITKQKPEVKHRFLGVDVAEQPTPFEKAASLRRVSSALYNQKAQLTNPDGRVALTEPSRLPALQESVKCLTGILNGDSPKFQRFFWEFPFRPREWAFQQSTVSTTTPFGGREQMVFFDEENGHLREDATIRRERLHDSDQRGNSVWGKRGLLVHRMGTLPVTLYTGEVFDQNGAVMVPGDEKNLAAVWCFVSSEEYAKTVRTLDNKVGVTPATLSKVPFDLSRWQTVAKERYPYGLPKPFSSDATQWLFNGEPKDSDQPLQVATARLLGYQWPRQTGSSFLDCSQVQPDGLEKLADSDGIVPINPAKGEAPAAERLRELLADAYGKDWKASQQEDLLAIARNADASLEVWLRNEFFEQHCLLFYQRPFVWHIWDGEQDGFNALVNYHQLAAPNHQGRKALEKLTYAYLGDWIGRQKAEQKQGKEGADVRLAAALHLQEQLKRIIEGEPPYDLFARWKPLHEQAIGWEPDINDGVRMNIRPFIMAETFKGKSIFRKAPKIKWERDRGKEPERSKRDFPWFWSWDEETHNFAGGREFDGNRWNDLHYSNKTKEEARTRRAEGGR